MTYSYISEDNFTHKQSYSYTPFCGSEFLKAYFNSRKIQELPKNKESVRGGELFINQNIFTKAYEDLPTLLLLVKTFEVNKCLYDSYSYINTELGNTILKPDKSTTHKNPINYSLFALSLINAFEKTKNLIYLNTLLKLNDTLISTRALLDFTSQCPKSKFYELFGFSIQKECEYVKNILQDKFGTISPTLKYNPKNSYSPQFSKPSGVLKMIDVAVIYGISSRSLLYIQAMLSQNLMPTKVLMLITPRTKQDLVSEHLNFLSKYAINVEMIYCDSVNDELCFKTISALREKYILHSAGGILQAKYFKLPKKFVHIHAGSLPAFRGSTTCYYELLCLNRIGASCMFLSEGLDDGDVIAETLFEKDMLKSFNTLDIDTFIEPYIRAKTLLKALNVILEDKIEPRKQDNSSQNTFYKIHPVLKHIAILWCFE